MKIDWCKMLGHKWVPVYIIGWFADNKVKFIATECKRCKIGNEDILKLIRVLDPCTICSYSEKYYNELNK